MSSISHDPASVAPQRGRWSARLNVPDMWASLAIGVIWLAVLCDAIWGPDLLSTSGSSSTSIPSAVIVAFFAWLATRAVAKYGFGRGDETS